MVKEAFEKAKKPRVDYTVPKADMHVHISLGLSDEGFKRRFQAGRTQLPLDFIAKRKKRYYQNLTEFHNTYEACRGLTGTPQELAETTQNYLERLAREGAIYAEISNSFREGAQFEAQMEAVSQAIESARHNTGIEARIVVTSLRNYGAEKAEEAVSSIGGLRNQFPLITVAWDAGFGLTPHVAEQHLHNAVDFLDAVPAEAWDINPNDHRRLRVGHGVLIHMSSDLMREFVERQIAMELCISANKRIGLPDETKNLKKGDVITATESNRRISIDQDLQLYYEQAEAHPIKKFMDMGVPVCLGSDNPLLMNTNAGKEYSMAHKAGVVNESDHLLLTQDEYINSL